MQPGSVTRSVLDPDERTVGEWIETAGRFVTSFLGDLDDAPAVGPALPAALAHRLGQPPPAAPGRFEDLLATFGEAAGHAMSTAGPRFFAYVPGGGLMSSAIAEMLARAVNRQTAVAWAAPGLVTLEQGVLRWLCAEFGLPEGSSGVITTGASMGTLSVVVAARHRHLGEEFGDGVLYVSDHTHFCVAKAARIAGLRHVRVVPSTAELTMDVPAVARMIARDRAAGLRPFLVVGNAGTTSTGAVDRLDDLAALARREDLWLHVDGAYGGFFQLTRRGRDLFTGIGEADSVTLDPHKGLFLPYGTGVLLVRDLAALRAAHAEDAPYLTGDDAVLPNYGDLGAELTREFRGLRLWLPLHLHGVDAFRATLDEMLDLAAHAHEVLRETPGVAAPWPPPLSTAVFRSVDGNEATRRLLERVHAANTVSLSATTVHERTMIRMCLLSHRSHQVHVDEALDLVRAAASGQDFGSSSSRPPAAQI